MVFLCPIRPYPASDICVVLLACGAALFPHYKTTGIIRISRLCFYFHGTVPFKNGDHRWFGCFKSGQCEPEPVIQYRSGFDTGFPGCVCFIFHP